MKNNKLKLPAIIIASIVATQASSSLLTPLRTKAMPINKNPNTPNPFKKYLGRNGIITGSLIGITILSSTGTGISIGSIINTNDKNSTPNKDDNNDSQKKPVNGIVFWISSFLKFSDILMYVAIFYKKI